MANLLDAKRRADQLVLAATAMASFMVTIVTFSKFIDPGVPEIGQISFFIAFFCIFLVPVFWIVLPLHLWSQGRWTRRRGRHLDLLTQSFARPLLWAILSYAALQTLALVLYGLGELLSLL